ncbi:MAG: helix-turn-helix transcriptional regulator [Acidimicrobiia bacterium]
MVDKFSVSLGVRLRTARRQRGWSLGEVEAFTDGQFKASVVGAYERGERAISVQRLTRLAEVYGVGPTDMFPGAKPAEGRVIDIDAVAAGRDHDLVDRYLAAIQFMRREGPSGEVRDSDKAVISSLLETAINTMSDPD